MGSRAGLHDLEKRKIFASVGVARSDRQVLSQVTIPTALCPGETEMLGSGRIPCPSPSMRSYTWVR